MNFSFELFAGMRSPLENFFASVEEKIMLYEEHIDTTVAHYDRQMGMDIAKNTAEYQIENARAVKAFDIAYDEWDGDAEFRHAAAMHESGLADVENAFESHEQMIREENEELLDYFNKSSLIMLYSLLESEQKHLCQILKELKGTKISVSDFESRDYIGGSFKYLELVIDLDKAPFEPFATKLKDVQYVRNRVVHDHSEFSMADDEVLNKVLANAKGLIEMRTTLDEERRILRLFKPAYIKNQYQLVRELFTAFFWEINEKFGYPVLQDRLRRLFRQSFPDVVISIEKVEDVKGGRLIMAEVMTTAANFKCNIKITRAKKRTFNFINQIDRNEKIDACIAQLKTRENKMIAALWKLVEPSPELQIDLMFYQ
jgi:hypothetical protein